MGVLQSGVSLSNRIFHRTPTYDKDGKVTGYFYSSDDFDSNQGDQDIFDRPTDYKKKGGEFIASIPKIGPNGEAMNAQVYLLANAAGKRVDDVDPALKIVSHANRPRHNYAVINGTSCFHCHDQLANGVISPKNNPLADHLRSNANLFVGRGITLDVLNDFKTQAEIAPIYVKDQGLYKKFQDATGGRPGAVFDVANAFDDDMSERQVAAELGLTVEQFRHETEKNPDLSRRLALNATGVLPKLKFLAEFKAVVGILALGGHVDLPGREVRPPQAPVEVAKPGDPALLEEAVQNLETNFRTGIRRDLPLLVRLTNLEKQARQKGLVLGGEIGKLAKIATAWGISIEDGGNQILVNLETYFQMPSGAGLAFVPRARKIEAFERQLLDKESPEKRILRLRAVDKIFLQEEVDPVLPVLEAASGVTPSDNNTKKRLKNVEDTLLARAKNHSTEELIGFAEKVFGLTPPRNASQQQRLDTIAQTQDRTSNPRNIGFQKQVEQLPVRLESEFSRTVDPDRANTLVRLLAHDDAGILQKPGEVKPVSPTPSGAPISPANIDNALKSLEQALPVLALPGASFEQRISDLEAKVRFDVPDLNAKVARLARSWGIPVVGDGLAAVLKIEEFFKIPSNENFEFDRKVKALEEAEAKALKKEKIENRIARILVDRPFQKAREVDPILPVFESTTGIIPVVNDTKIRLKNLEQHFIGRINERKPAEFIAFAEEILGLAPFRNGSEEDRLNAINRSISTSGLPKVTDLELYTREVARRLGSYLSILNETQRGNIIAKIIADDHEGIFSERPAANEPPDLGAVTPALEKLESDFKIKADLGAFNFERIRTVELANQELRRRQGPNGVLRGLEKSWGLSPTSASDFRPTFERLDKLFAKHGNTSGSDLETRATVYQLLEQAVLAQETPEKRLLHLFFEHPVVEKKDDIQKVVSLLEGITGLRKGNQSLDQRVIAIRNHLIDKSKASIVGTDFLNLAEKDIGLTPPSNASFEERLQELERRMLGTARPNGDIGQRIEAVAQDLKRLGRTVTADGRQINNLASILIQDVDGRLGPNR